MKNSFDRLMIVSLTMISISVSIPISEPSVQISSIHSQSPLPSLIQKSASLKNSFENQIFHSRFQNNRWSKNTKSQNDSFHKFSFRNISDAFAFLNPYINGIKTWGPKIDSLCVKCEKLNHMSKECIDRVFFA